MTESIFDRVIVPVASETDAEATCEALRPHLQRTGGEAHLVHVIEERPKYIDKAAIEQRKKRTDRIFDTATDVLDDEYAVETHVEYDPNVPNAVRSLADELDATAIVFVTRNANRFHRFLTGDVALELITDNAYPTVVLPEPSSDKTGSSRLRQWISRLNPVPFIRRILPV